MYNTIMNQIKQQQEMSQQQMQQQIQAAISQAFATINLNPGVASSNIPTSASPVVSIPNSNPFLSTPSNLMSNHSTIIAKPNFYTGALNQNADTWLFSIEQYCNAAGIRANDDNALINIASSYLKDLAYTWWYNVCAISNTRPTSWNQFKSD